MRARFSFLLTPLIIASAHAVGTHGPPGSADDPRGIRVVCERLLNNESADQKTKFLDDEFLGRPFLVWAVHDMTGEGLRKMGLDPHSSERALKDLVLLVERSTDKKTLIVKLNRYANFGFKTIQHFEFSEPVLTGYRAIALANEHRRLGFEQLQLEYPDSGSEGRQNFWVGYQTEPDMDGVRRYITFGKTHSLHSISSSITLGLDVPPALGIARRYSEDLAEVTDDLRTPSGNWRRIGVLAFGRMD